MRGDGGQHVVARQEQTVGWVVETKMVVGVPRSMDSKPRAVTDGDLVAVVK